MLRALHMPILYTILMIFTIKFAFIIIFMRRLGVMSMKINVFGHRGFGASDSVFHFARDERIGIQRIAENTLESHKQALAQGAKGVEMDAIETADGLIVSTHADEVGQHIKVPYTAPHKYVGRMTFEELQRIPVGPGGACRIPLLKDILVMMKTEFPDRLINIELKGKMGNLEDNSHTQPTLSEKVVRVIEECDFPLGNVIFSSFALSYLEELDDVCRRKNIQVKKGILFDLAESATTDDIPLEPILRDRSDYYIPLTLDSLQKAHRHFSVVYSIHAEIRSLTPAIVSYLREHNLQLYTWGLKEPSPLENTVEGQDFAAAVQRGVQMARAEGLEEINLITDHVLEMQTFVQTIH